MVQPTEEELKLYEKLDATTTKEEKAEIEKELREYLLKREEEFTDYPFAH